MEAAEQRPKQPRRYVRCPHCGARSRKLWSEMGGLETRECHNGHRFEFDRWIADRMIWAPGTSPFR